MSNTNFTYKTIASASSAEFSDRGSKFIGFAYPVTSVEQIKECVKQLKAAHPKAVHYCYAYRLGFNHSNYRANDDGEPAGSAGRPILGQIDSLQITNVLVVVVRYFGGVLLGVPGLIHAYKVASQMALSQNAILERNRMLNCTLKFDYTQMNEVMRILKAYSCEIKSQTQGLFCEMNIGIALADQETILSKLRNIQGVEVEETQ